MWVGSAWALVGMPNACTAPLSHSLNIPCHLLVRRCSVLSSFFQMNMASSAACFVMSQGPRMLCSPEPAVTSPPTSRSQVSHLLLTDQGLPHTLPPPPPQVIMDREAAPVATDDPYMAQLRPMLAGTSLEEEPLRWVSLLWW